MKAMVEINLLPWRAALRAKNARIRKIFFIYCGALFFLGSVVHWGVNEMLENTLQAVAQLQDHLTQLTGETRQDFKDPYVLSVQQIRSQQQAWLAFLNIAMRGIASNMSWLTLVHKGGRTVMTGYADSLGLLSRFVEQANRGMSGAPLVIVRVTTVPGLGALHFRLQFNPALPSLDQVIHHATV
jgi:hypothetical protein